MVSNSPSYKPCHCRRTGCFKLYCDCLRAGLLCSDKCKCCGCKNRVPNEQREKLLNLVKAKVDFSSPSPHHGSSLTPTRGCHCKKSGCLKNYCECFQNGQPCSTRCSCSGCKNNNMSYIIGNRKSSGRKQIEGSNSNSGENNTPGKQLVGMGGQQMHSTSSQKQQMSLQNNSTGFADKVAEGISINDYNSNLLNSGNSGVNSGQNSDANFPVNCQLGINGQPVINNYQQHGHFKNLIAVQDGAGEVEVSPFQTPVKRAFNNAGKTHHQQPAQQQHQQTYLLRDNTFMADRESSEVSFKKGEGISEHKEEDMLEVMGQQSVQDDRKGGAGVAIQVHDRFLTETGAFVDASMIRTGGPAQLGPSQHGMMNELQDSDMVFEEDDDLDDDSDSHLMVPQAPPKGLGAVLTPLTGHNQKPEQKWPPLLKAPIAKTFTVQEPARSAPVHKHEQSSATETEKEDGSADVQPASDRATSAPRANKKASKSQSTKKGATSSSQAKPSQVRTRAQKCKKTDKAAPAQ